MTEPGLGTGWLPFREDTLQSLPSVTGKASRNQPPPGSGQRPCVVSAACELVVPSQPGGHGRGRRCSGGQGDVLHRQATPRHGGSTTSVHPSQPAPRAPRVPLSPPEPSPRGCCRLPALPFGTGDIPGHQGPAARCALASSPLGARGSPRRTLWSTPQRPLLGVPSVEVSGQGRSRQARAPGSPGAQLRREATCPRGALVPPLGARCPRGRGPGPR